MTRMTVALEPALETVEEVVAEEEDMMMIKKTCFGKWVVSN